MSPEPRSAEIGLDDLVVAVDGPSGTGKSTVSRQVAERLGLRYLDTGAMYRALTWWVLKQGVDPGDVDRVAVLAGSVPLEIGTDPTTPDVTVGDIDVAVAIRGPEVTAAVSAVSSGPVARQLMVDRQRALIGRGGIVVEGRDIGTVVVPDAAVKIFLTAAPEVRALRRANQDVAGAAGTVSSAVLDRTRADLDRRDDFDSSRKASPLVQAPDALALDTSSMALDDVVAAVLQLVKERT